MKIVGLAICFVLLSLVFSAVESLWPSIPTQRKLRSGLGTDLLYWFFTPLVSRAISLLALLIALAPLLLLFGYRLEQQELQSAIHDGHAPVLLWPYWLQGLLIFAGGDFIDYWTHRWFHGRRLWGFHAIHHSSKEVDWLSSLRLHPVNDLGTRFCKTIPLVLLGFSPTVIAAYVFFITVYALLLHANVPWTFGPLRFVLASPAFHRWHHATDARAINKNFASLLPVYDLLFGTFYKPADQQPTEFGVHDDAVPEGILGQMLYPFERTSRVS
jgi:sterol desaturase/sphingolipid hydroxylase (fatty acid hydroxylase superfamily)